MVKEDWKEHFKNEIEKPYFKELTAFIEEEYRTKIIFPVKKDIFTAFELCAFSDVKVVIIGQDPYHNYNQAHGLAFSVLKGSRIPPSLQNIYKELESDLGVKPPAHGELTSWAKNGILLLNTILTVEAHKPLSHKKKGWEIFTDAVIRMLNEDNRPKVFVLWGNNAINKSKYITNKNHLILQSSHPSPLSARHSFFGSKVFSKINTFMKQSGQSEIDFSIK